MGRGYGEDRGGRIGGLEGLRERIERLFEEDVHPRQGGGRGVWTPPVDIVDEGGRYVVTAEVPGMSQGDIDVEIGGDRLILRGERAGSPVENLRTFHRMERPEGPFQRSFRLPDEVDASRVAAVYRDGVLRIELPKKAVSLPTSIPVEE